MLPLLTPWFTHPTLEAAGSADRLGLPMEVARELSDRSVSELVLWSGDFRIAGPDGRPFYDADERGHLRDARVLLWMFLLAGGISALGLAAALLRRPDRRPRTWDIIGRAGLTMVVGVTVVGLVGVVAFDPLFTLFHQVFFPGGNWSFDPATQRLVQLYPFRFWQFASAALGTLLFVLGLGTWLLGRWQSRSTPAHPIPADPTPTGTSG